MKTLFLDTLNSHYDALMVANGQPIRRSLFRTLKNRCSHIVALDGGLEILKKRNILPDFVTGDFDSVSPETLNWARQRRVKIERRSNEDKPDIAKGFDFCAERGFRHVLVCCITGTRTDHLLSSFHYSLNRRIPIVHLVTDEIAILPFRGKTIRKFAIPAGHTISWFGFPRAEGCTLTGVHWPFTNRIIGLDNYFSLSNEPADKIVRVYQQRGRSVFMVSLSPAFKIS